MRIGEQQNYYKLARDKAPKEVSIHDIQGVCKKCGYVELAPTTSFESFNGGLMVPRKGLRIVNENGVAITKLRPTPSRKINQYWGCNNCINKW